MAEYKIKVIGSGGVGKSALTIKFIQNTFVEKVCFHVCVWYLALSVVVFISPHRMHTHIHISMFICPLKYDPTIEDSYRKQIDVDGSAVMLDITDTAGQEEYAEMRDELLGDGDGFVVVYSITDPTSFEEVSNLYESILKTKSKEEGIPCILAGNKVDMENDRAVPREHGEEQAKKMGPLCRFFETSARADPAINVKEIFEELVRLINQKEGGVKESTTEATTGEDKTAAAPSAPPKKVEKKKKPCLIL